MGAPPHCLDCPVRKQRRHPNRGPKGPPSIILYIILHV
jgi:hypothetical protein